MVDALKVLHPDFGKRLALAMQRARPEVHVADIAKACGVTHEAARRWTLGVAMPRPPHLKKLALLLGLHPSELQHGRINETNAAPGLLAAHMVELTPDESQLVDQYRQLPDFAAKMLRSRAAELVEGFAKRSNRNPFGDSGTQ